MRFVHRNVFTHLLSTNTKLFSQNKSIKSYDNPQQYLALELMQRQNRLRSMQKQLQLKIDKSIKFPVKLCGYGEHIEQAYSYIPERIMQYYRIHTSTITQFLLKIYKASLYAIADSNQSFMNQYWENGLKTNVIKQLKPIKQKYHIKVLNNSPDFLSPINQKVEILDSIFIRGLSADRQKNQHPNSYRKYQEADQVGLITYTPLRLTQNNQAFINPATNKNVYDGYDQCVLRLLLRIKTPLRIVIEQFPVKEQIYTWQHLCIMQNSMVPPPLFKTDYKIETLMEWLGKYRFGLWKMSDIDNFMHGNSLFRGKIQEEPLDPVFKETKYDKSYYINIRDF